MSTPSVWPGFARADFIVIGIVPRHLPCRLHCHWDCSQTYTLWVSFCIFLLTRPSPAYPPWLALSMTESANYYRFVECTNMECRLRFPGAFPIACPKCKTETRLASERCPAAAEQAPSKFHPLHLFLDNVRSVFNVGSIFRTAEGCGVQKIYLGGICPTPVHSAMKKTALGAETLVAWQHHNNSVLLARQLVSEGYTLWALEKTLGSIDLLSLAPCNPAKLVLVLGNEVTGVDPGVLSLCQKIVHIPMRGDKVSLNVATAVGIAAYALCTPMEKS